MDVSFCMAALEEAALRFPKPQIFNTDQGSRFRQHGLYRHTRTRSVRRRHPCLE
jgi:putative transposase